jgi:hypothetical protein
VAAPATLYDISFSTVLMSGQYFFLNFVRRPFIGSMVSLPPAFSQVFRLLGLTRSSRLALI